MYGERLGYKGDDFEFIARQPRLSDEHSAAASEKVRKRLTAGTVLGPFSRPPKQVNFRCSPLVIVAQR